MMQTNRRMAFVLAVVMFAGCGGPGGSERSGTGDTAAGSRQPGWKQRVLGAPAAGEVVAGAAAEKELRQADDRPTIIRKIDDAVALAEAAVTKQYGVDAAAGQRPYTAVIVDNTHWLVLGTPAQGKVAQVRLRVSGGQVVSVDLLPEQAVGKLPRGGSSGQFAGMYE